MNYFDLDYVFYCKDDIYGDKRQVAVSGFETFVKKLQEVQIAVISFTEAQLLSKSFQEYLGEQGRTIQKGICLTSSEKWLMKAIGENMAVVVFENPQMLGENLWAANNMILDFFKIEPDDINKFYQRHHQIPWTILETERCTVMEQTMDDLKLLHKMYESKEILKYVEPLFEPVLEAEYMESYIEHVYGFYGYGLWSIWEKERGIYLGRAGVSNREFDGEIQLELGYVIDEKYHRQGYGFEICSAILEYAKTVLEMTKINCLIQKENEKSILLAEKLGFRWKEEVLVETQKLQRFYKDA